MTKIFTPPKPKSDFLVKGGVKPPKINQKLNQLRFGSNFQGKIKPINDQSWLQKFLAHLSQNPNFGKKCGGGVETPQNQPKTQPTRIWLKFSG